MKFNRNKFLSREIFLLFIIIILIIIFNSQSDNFISRGNLPGLFMNISVNSILVVGMTILLISGSFDMSIGTLFPLLGVIFGVLVEIGFPLLLSAVITIFISAIVGLIIGISITKLRVNPFITTLSGLFIFEALSWIIGLRGALNKDIGVTTPTFRNFPESFLNVAGGKFYDLEYINFYAIFIIIFFFIFLKRNLFFRQAFFIGNNFRAAKLAGIKVNQVIIFNHIIMSLLVAVTVLLKVSRVGSATAQSGGTNLSLNIIAAAFIGGAALSGGKGSIIGSVLGVILLVLFDNGLAILGISPVYTNIFLGIIIVISVVAEKISYKVPLRV